MFNSTRLAELKEELAIAERDAKPVVIELTSETKDERVYTNLTTGTVRQDFLGGDQPQYVDRVAVVEEIPAVCRPVPKEIGKVIKENEDEREIKLVSGTLRVDLK